MKIPRRYTTEGQSPYHGIDFDRRTSEIKNPDGSTVFRQDGIAVPSAWSAVATDILAQSLRPAYPESDAPCRRRAHRRFRPYRNSVATAG